MRIFSYADLVRRWGVGSGGDLGTYLQQTPLCHADINNNPDTAERVQRALNSYDASPPAIGIDHPSTKQIRMFDSLQPLLYIQISPDQVVIRNPRSNTALSEAAEIALTQQGGKPRVLAVGAQAHMAAAAEPGARLVRPFAHPRSLVSDFGSAELLLKALVKQSVGKGFLPASPAAVMHPLGSPEGGFTAVELRAFRELALGAGAYRVQVWTGRPLTDDELRSRRFPSDGGQLASS